MTHFQHSLAIAAAPATVFAALSTIEGLQGWWTEDCDGSTRSDGIIHFRFGACYKDMRVLRMVPQREVHWRCTRAHVEAPQVERSDEWVGTEPVFVLAPDEQGGTILHFEHLGLLPALQCFGVCSAGWRQFLASLKQYAETGSGNPYLIERRTAA